MPTGQFNLFENVPDLITVKRVEIKVHEVENNQRSQEYLQENELKIKKSCKKVLDILMQGIPMTVNGAVTDYGISSLPRRIKDLRDENKIQIHDRKIKGNESTYIEYYMDYSEIQRLKQLF